MTSIILLNELLEIINISSEKDIPQYSHNASTVQITLPLISYSTIELHYKTDYTEGSIAPTSVNVSTSTIGLIFLIPQIMTLYAGKLKCWLVVKIIDNNNNITSLFASDTFIYNITKTNVTVTTIDTTSYDLLLALINTIINGTTPANKATNDADGNEISSTYLKLINIANYLVDNVISTNVDKGLTANQGKVLKDLIDSITSGDYLIDSLTSSDIEKGLTANQGRVLKSYIDALNTGKISISDIVDTLVSTSTIFPLSANQGKALKDLLDTHEADNTNPHLVTKAQVGLGNADNTSDLNKPVSTAMQNSLNLKADIDDTCYTFDMTLSSDFILTIALKDLNGNTLVTKNVDFPLEEMGIVSGTYNAETKTLILTLANSDTISIPIGDLIDGLQSEITPTNKLSSDLVDDTNHTNLFVTSAEKSTWNAKQNALVSGTNIKTIASKSIVGSGNVSLDKNDVGLGNIDNTSDLNKPVSTATQTSLNTKQDKTLVYSSVNAIFSADTTYESYGYRSSLSLTGVTSTCIATVVFSLEQSNSGNYAPICETGSGVVYIYSKVANAITIPTIMVEVA